MVAEIKVRACNGHLFKWLMAAGVSWLKHKEDVVNQLNVFPVPDGDTGTNMWMTLQKAYDSIAHLNENSVGLVSEQLANGALRSGQGNSGVILSQLISGFAGALKGHDEFDAQLFAVAYRRGVEAAYQAVLDPVEGTILTVAKDSADALEHYLKSRSSLAGALHTLLDAARTSLAHTPELLPILKKANVVDSGGQGLVFILEGMERIVRGQPVQIPHPGETIIVQPTASSTPHTVDLSSDDADGYGYDVQFLLHGETLAIEQIRAAIAAMGWSTLVVGNEQLVKVHVHVHDPGQPLSYVAQHFPPESGVRMDSIIVENMQAQYEERFQSNLAEQSGMGNPVDGVAVISVVSGKGLRTLFVDELNATYIISGGQTMNPNADAFIKAIKALPNQEIILLPNNKNIVMAAEQAAKLVQDKTVRVVKSTTIPQGIAAMFAYANRRPDEALTPIALKMDEAIQQVTTGSVIQAVRDSRLNGLAIQKGQYIGLLEGDLAVTGDNLAETLRNLLQHIVKNAPPEIEYEIITLYYGHTINDTQAQQLVNDLAATFNDLAFEIVRGDQPLYPIIFSVE